MGVHLVVVAAFHLSRGSMSFSIPRIAANLIWPFLVKLCLSLKIPPQDLVSSSSFLLFQISQIFNHQNNTNNNSTNTITTTSTSTSTTRLDRAVRLVRQRLALARDSSSSLAHDDEESLRILSMLAL
ncbi:hypothetical protein BVRB_5g123110 [Beta vulgaris subsp. vulgaris]|uniref:Uncharacterized protein n=1 Tax=Beta vulgaris subsp. vulgaris TaxID=3555 RepID=A0A0J8BAC3_BETVV|nr:hypothetical protein BVRB_5g123110 [Beta vulgaris subsp. vulgaris]